MLKGQRLIKALDISVRLMEASDEVIDGGGERLVKRSKESEERSTMRGDPIDGDGWVNVAQLDERSAGIVNQIVARWHANCQIRYLMQAENLWPLYITGVLAKAMGLSRTELDEKKSLILSTFSERLQSRHLLPTLTGKHTRELLEIAERNTWQKFRKIDPFFDDSDDEASSETWTMFKNGAGEEAISELEDRLGISLPEDYKEFLRITNGFEDDERGIFTGITTDAGLLDISKVEWNENFQYPGELLPVPRETAEEFGDFETRYALDDHDGLGWDTAVPLFDRVVEIARCDIDSIVLIPPETVQKIKAAYHVMLQRANAEGKAIIRDAMDCFAGSERAFNEVEWACCTIGDEATVTPFPSFRRYLESAATESTEEPWKGDEDDEDEDREEKGEDEGNDEDKDEDEEDEGEEDENEDEENEEEDGDAGEEEDPHVISQDAAGLSGVYSILKESEQRGYVEYM